MACIACFTYAVTRDVSLPIRHAFIVDDAGAYELTLQAPAILYYGVEFAPTALLEPVPFCDPENWSENNAAAVKRFESARLKNQ